MIKKIICENYTEMSYKAAEHVFNCLQKAISQKRSATLIPSAGGTPELLYKILASDYKNTIDWSLVTLYQMDEYLDLPIDHPSSFAFYIKNKIIEPLGIKKCFFLNDENGAPSISLNEYDQLLLSNKIDLIINGIGENGHLAYNEPGTLKTSTTRQVNLTSSTIQANSRFFNTINDVPTKGLTIGLSNIMNARENLVLATGPKKRNALNAALNETESLECPASVLQNHPNTTFIIDKKACPQE